MHKVILQAPLPHGLPLYIALMMDEAQGRLVSVIILKPTSTFNNIYELNF